MTPASSAQLGSEEDPFLAIHLPGSSPAVRELRRLVARLNSTENADLVRVILIHGESGAGKNRLAQVIAAHRRWIAIRDTDADPGLEAGMEPLLDQYGEIHLPSLPETLVESELFGYVEGAFTGARKGGKAGLLGRDDYAEILLDEVGDASKLLQAKLLAVVEHGRFRPVGGDFDVERTTSARLLLATNRDLKQLVLADGFREDLYWRAMEFSVRVPPLRDQRENIPDIMRYLHRVLTKPLRGGLREPPDLSKDDLAWAPTYEWPGNVRHLRHAIKRWLFEAGRRSLQAIVEDLRREMPLGQPQRSPPLTALVRQRLASILGGEAQSPGGPGKFVDEFRDQVRAAVHDWYREHQPGEEDLRRLFSEGTMESIRNKISQWGRKNREGTS
jgi:transcriptional regulator with PAS, ATPase and Fis domain